MSGCVVIPGVVEFGIIIIIVVDVELFFFLFILFIVVIDVRIGFIVKSRCIELDRFVLQRHRQIS